jgi:hypothetical protein
MLCVCGADCEGCKELGKSCLGCNKIKGQVFWATRFNADICPIYKCVEERGYLNCGDCPRLPCQTWIDLRDPSQSEEDHQKSIRERVKILTVRNPNTG